MVAPTEEEKRFTETPVLAVEVLSTDPAADLRRKARKYAALGLPHYWVIDTAGPEITEYRLPERGGAYEEIGRHAGKEPATLTIAGQEAVVVPAKLTR